MHKAKKYSRIVIFTHVLIPHLSNFQNGDETLKFDAEQIPFGPDVIYFFSLLRELSIAIPVISLAAAALDDLVILALT